MNSAPLEMIEFTPSGLPSNPGSTLPPNPSSDSPSSTPSSPLPSPTSDLPSKSADNHSPDTQPRPWQLPHLAFPSSLLSSPTSDSLRPPPSSYTPRQLYEMLISHRENTHPQAFVTSAWYGKLKNGAEHEYIMLTVEDRSIPGPRNKNVISIDRNQHGPPTAAVSSGTVACDTFKISSDGDLDQFLLDCQFTPHRMLEKVIFQSNEPLPLHDVTVLVEHISTKHTKYHVARHNCYWFAGLIWECMLHMRPNATHNNFFPMRRGSMGFLRRYTSKTQVRKAIKHVERLKRSGQP